MESLYGENGSTPDMGTWLNTRHGEHGSTPDIWSMAQHRTWGAWLNTGHGEHGSTPDMAQRQSGVSVIHKYHHNHFPPLIMEEEFCITYKCPWILKYIRSTIVLIGRAKWAKASISISVPQAKVLVIHLAQWSNRWHGLGMGNNTVIVI